ncbi:MAG: NUDIX hydrolase [Candidatus Nanopelagicales bacterium]
MGDKGIPEGTATRVTPGSDKKIPEAPRQIVAVDTALLTIYLKRKQLMVVESQRTDTGKWVLPGTFVYGRETLSDAVERCLRTKLNVQGIRPHRLDVLDAPDRDDRFRVISVAHVAVVRRDQLESIGEAEYPTRLVPVDRPGELMWDHPEIVRLAKRYVRSRYKAAPDPDELLEDEFTLPELQQVHEAVAGKDLDTYQFRRKMKDLVDGTGSHRPLAPGSLGRPAELFRKNRDGE